VPPGLHQTAACAVVTGACRLHQTALHAAHQDCTLHFMQLDRIGLQCMRIRLSNAVDCSSRSSRRLQTAVRAALEGRRRLPCRRCRLQLAPITQAAASGFHFLQLTDFCKIPARQGPARALPARPRPTPCTALMAKICHPGDTGMRRKSMAVSNPPQRAIDARRQLGG
jgi:hypothetical protein